VLRLQKRNQMTDKKQHILNQSIGLFAKKGFEGTSIRDIASAAEVNVAMIHYYFGNKEMLFKQLVENKAAATRGILDNIANDKSLSSIQKIDQIIETYVDRIFSHRDFHRVIHQELMLSDRVEAQNTIVNLLYPNSFIIRSIIDNGIRKSDFKKVDPELTVATMMGTIHQVLLSRKFCNKFINREDDYIPYDDPAFRKRVIEHMKNLMRNHLEKKD
jgi:AcrR family transcriptional regulator